MSNLTENEIAGIEDANRAIDESMVTGALELFADICHHLGKAEAAWLLANNGVPEEDEDQLYFIRQEAENNQEAAWNKCKELRDCIDEVIDHPGYKLTVEQLANRADMLFDNSLITNWGRGIPKECGGLEE